MTDDVDTLRPRMMSVAYTRLGSVVDGASSPAGFQICTPTRPCIDGLRERKRRRYVGPCKAEPVEARGRESALSESPTQTFPLLLARWTPDERAGVSTQKPGDCAMRATTVNNEPGVVPTSGGAVAQDVARLIEGSDRAVSMTNNPDSLPCGGGR